jgi:hypothetical protein
LEPHNLPKCPKYNHLKEFQKTGLAMVQVIESKWKALSSSRSTSVKKERKRNTENKQKAIISMK